MARWRVALLMTAFVAAAIPASAAKIGLSGGISDPQAITDPGWQLLTVADCGPALFPEGYEDYRCALYDGSMVGDITSIDFRMKDGHGNLIPFPDSIDVDPLSALGILTSSPLTDDGHTFRLSADGTFDCIVCVFFSSHDNGLADPLYVSIFAVNGVVNVPEPATLLLLGPGAALALWRRRRLGRRQI